MAAMDHRDHVELLRPGIAAPGGTWADFGAGRGAFTLALSELIGPGGVIYAVDRDRGALRANERALRAGYPAVTAHAVAADFTRPLALPPLDGLVMANALHFLRQKEAAVARLKSYLKPGGRWLLVEYNTDRGNVWVPHPLSFATWAELAGRCGFGHTELLATRPSRFLGEIYAAASW